MKKCWRIVIAVMVALASSAMPVSAQSGEALLAAKFKEATEAQRAGHLNEAAAAYAEVVKLRPDIAEAYVNYGLVRYEQRQFDAAIELFERALTLKPTLDGARLFLGISYYSTNRLEQSLKILEGAARSTPNDPQTLMWYGVASMAAGKTEQASKLLDQAATLAPDNIDILYHRGRAHLKLSQESYRQMFKTDPKSARVHMVLGQSYAESGRDAEAAAEYEAAIKLAPTMPGVHEAVGNLYWKNRQMDEAESAYEQELKIDPFNTLAMYKLGSLRVERGQPAEGMKLLEASIAQSPDNFDAYYYLGKAQALTNQNEAAVVNLRKMIEGDPTSELAESAYYQLARVYRKIGRTQEAQAALSTFQKLRDEREQQRVNSLEESRKQEADTKPQL